MRHVAIALRLLLLLALVPACSTATATATASSKSFCLDATPRAAKPTAYNVEIVESAKVRRPYKVIGFVKAEVAKSSDKQQIVSKLQIEARQLGGDALLDLSHGPANGSPPAPVFSHLKSGGTVPQECFSYYEYGSSQEIWAARVIVWE